MLKTLYYLAAVLTICSCANSRQATEGGTVALQMQYARLLDVTEHEGYLYAQITNPWDTTAVLHSYVLVEAGHDVPDNLPQGDVVTIPLTKTVSTTSVITSLFDELGAYDAVAGVCDLQYHLMPKVHSDVAAGRIADVGESSSPNQERLIDLQPDAVFVSPYEGNEGYGKLTKLGIPLIECADYMENTPLGRAEWMRFYGLLTGTAERADSLFDAVSKQYNELAKMAAEAKEKPSVLCDTKFGSTWYVPGGNSTTGNLLKDAGATYIFADEDTSGSLPLAPEAVFDRGTDAQFWIFKYNQATEKTYRELQSDYPNYAHLFAFKAKNVFACNTGKNNFYEDTPFHPDVLLREYIKILHPQLLPKYQLQYFQRLGSL